MTVEVINRLKMSGNPERIIEALEFVKYNDYGIGTIDFNKITPMPKWVYDGKLLTKEIEKKYGAGNCWYQWCIKNWGTKWNSFLNRLCEDDNAIIFFTADSGVPALMRKLAFIFPKVEFEYSYSSNVFGANVGKFKFKDTEVWFQLMPQFTKEAYELSFELVNATPEECGFVFDKNINTYVPAGGTIIN